MTTPRGPADRTAQFAEPMRRLDSRRFVEFCAALWAARGYETRVEGERVVATRNDERVVVLARAAPGRVERAFERVRTAVFARRTTVASPADTDVDVVAAAAAGTAERLASRLDARPAGPGVLADRLLYGLDRADANALATRYLGASTGTLLATRTSGSDERDGGRSRTSHESGGIAPSAGGVGIAAVACLVVAAVGVGVLTVGIGDVGAAAGLTGATDAVDGSAGGGADTVLAGGSATGDDAAGDDPNGGASAYPPGIDAGSLDVDRLVDAHTAAMDGRSYRVAVRRAGNSTVGGSRRWEGTSWHATVETDRVWRYTVSRYADGEDGPDRTGYSVYADGEFAYRRAGEGANASFARYPVRVEENGTGRVAERVREYLGRYLATTAVRVHRPTRNADTYRVVASGQPTRLGRDVTEYTAIASVTSDGRVSRLVVEYTSREGIEEETVRFRLAYTALGEVTVRQPGWYDEATAATSANATRD